MKKIIKKTIKLFLEVRIINVVLVNMIRCILRSDIISYSYKKIVGRYSYILKPQKGNGNFRVPITITKKLKFKAILEYGELLDLYWWGKYAHEPETLLLFSNLVKTSKMFFDVGANIGWYSLLAKRLNLNLQVYSFEPIPQIYSLLQNNIQLNKLENEINLEQLAVADANKEQKIYLPKDNISSASLNSNFREDTTNVKVTCVTLDNYVKENSLSLPDLVKLDTETTEYQVLLGMNEILKTKNPNIICEVLDSCDTQRLTKIMDKYNYSYYLIGYKSLTKMNKIKRNKDQSWEKYQRCPYYNFFFTTMDSNSVNKLAKQSRMKVILNTDN